MVALTLLLDLDNTLLENGMDDFLPAYLQLLSQELAEYADPRTLVPELLSATKRMLENQRPDCTLKEVFDSAFYPALGRQPQEMAEPIERFYREIFPRLQPLTKARPEGVRLVEAALARGYRVVIATNPLFPRTAIEQRLVWAGLPVEKFPFELVTSYEGFHFAKPNPAYYAEIMARLAWPRGPVVMVGDDLENDVEPAATLGLPTFWFQQKGESLWSSQARTSGNLEEVLPWLERAENLEPDYTSPGAILAVLRSTPAILDTICRPLPASSWAQRPEPGEWCPTEIICHLRDVEGEVNLPRYQKVLAENNPFIPGQDTDPWAEQRQYCTQNGQEAAFRFLEVRMKALHLLESLSPAEWQRTARHAILGKTTLAELAGIAASHDRMHIRQLFAAIADGSQPA